VALVAPLLALLSPGAALAHPPGVTEQVSVSSQGTAGDEDSVLAAVRADGRFVAFSSSATNLVAGDVEDSATDVYLRDRQAGTTEGISTVNPPSGQVLHSGSPSLSADGRLVTSHSWESNLVPGDTKAASTCPSWTGSAGPWSGSA
jgi:hypothetical protein